jgi:glycerol-1-phosphate dehydrogenase [NAD(P)+]
MTMVRQSDMAPQADPNHAVRKQRVTRAVAVDCGAIRQLARLAADLLPGRRFIIVADANTFAAAGARSLESLRAAGLLAGEPCVLDGTPKVSPRVDDSARVADAVRRADAIPVAVGSGVINDLTKYAAALAERPYLSVATAASMDGYTASGAALLDRGFKRTFACPPPVALVADLDVIARAPAQMAAWGYGDLSGKTAAGGDWLLAEAVGEEPVDASAWDMVQGGLPDWLSAPEKISAADPEALRGLVQGLIVSGLAMQDYGTSRPASGSDHQFAHLWEMEKVSVGGIPVAHGACVGLGCIASLALFEWLLRCDLSRIDPVALARRQPDWTSVEREVRLAFPDPAIASNAVEEMWAKHHSPDRIAARLDRLRTRWADLKPRLQNLLPTPAQMSERLALLGGASTPEAIGLSRFALARDYARARLIRRRYTIFDVLVDLGCFEAAVSDLFAKGGYWFASMPADRSAMAKLARGS